MSRPYRKHVPKSKQLKNNPYATVGQKLRHVEGGMVTRKPLPDGRILVTVIDEYGRKTESIEEEATNGHH